MNPPSQITGAPIRNFIHSVEDTKEVSNKYTQRYKEGDKTKHVTHIHPVIFIFEIISSVPFTFIFANNNAFGSVTFLLRSLQI